MKINGDRKFALITLVLAMFICLGAGYALGQSSAYTSLDRTRNSLLEQRDHLLRLQAGYNDQITRLQSQLNVVGTYISDNDRALRDVETAMRNTN